jgi:hypothetical protein
VSARPGSGGARTVALSLGGGGLLCTPLLARRHVSGYSLLRRAHGGLVVSPPPTPVDTATCSASYQRLFASAVPGTCLLHLFVRAPRRAHHIRRLVDVARPSGAPALPQPRKMPRHQEQPRVVVGNFGLAKLGVLRVVFDDDSDRCASGSAEAWHGPWFTVLCDGGFRRRLRTGPPRYLARKTMRTRRAASSTGHASTRRP